MNLLSIFTPKSVSIDTSSLSKRGVLYTLSRLIAEVDSKLDEEELFNLFWQRENLGSTAIGFGICIPHIRVKNLTETHGAFVRLQNPVDFGAEDKQPVDLVIGLVLPEKNAEQHLQTLATLVEKFSDAPFRETCRAAKDSLQLHRLITQNSRESVPSHD